MSKARATEQLSTILEERITNYYTKLPVDEIGRVVSVGDGIARVYGLNKIQAGEMVEFASGVKGMAGELASFWHNVARQPTGLTSFLSLRLPRATQRKRSKER